MDWLDNCSHQAVDHHTLDSDYMEDEIDRTDPEQLASTCAQGIYAVLQQDLPVINPNLNNNGGIFQRYEYRPMEGSTATRLLHLYTPEPGSARTHGRAWPECEIFHTTTEEAGDYVAIFYSWDHFRTVFLSLLNLKEASNSRDLPSLPSVYYATRPSLFQSS